MSETAIQSVISRLVSSITPLDQVEQEHIGFVLHWLESGCEIFRTVKPATPDTHLVCYFVVVSPQTGQVLLVDHKKAGLWLPPGGHVEPGESPHEAVKRELREELGLEAVFLFDEPLFLTVTKTTGNIDRHTDVSLWYLIKGDPDKNLHFDLDEFHQIRWFRIDEIPFQQSDPHLERFIHKMILRGSLILPKIDNCHFGSG